MTSWWRYMSDIFYIINISEIFYYHVITLTSSLDTLVDGTWRHVIGYENWRGTGISLLLPLPDGDRWESGSKIHVELFGRYTRGGALPLFRMSKLISVQLLSHFEIRDFGRIWLKYRKFQFWDTLDKFELVCQSLSYEAEICTISSLYQDKKSGLKVLKNIFNFWFYATFCTKKC